MQRFILVTGGVLSSVGKGVLSASIGHLLENQGYSVSLMKLDPYLNVDPGTMNPFEHGEVYVTDDGAETDLDLGHYFRFTHTKLFKESSITSGQIYSAVIGKERKGEYLGKTVQVVPHVTDEIKARIMKLAGKTRSDFVIVEIGGTVGDLESGPFLEAIRQFKQERPQEVLCVHLTYLPYLGTSSEFKTKPTQHSVQLLLSVGIAADIIVCRSEQPIREETRMKISLFCNVRPEHVFSLHDVKTTIYEAPSILSEQKFDTALLRRFGLEAKEGLQNPLSAYIASKKKRSREVTIGLVGKYLTHKDAYKSVHEALDHSGFAVDAAVKLVDVESDLIQSDALAGKKLEGLDGILILGGFGERGWEGKIHAVRYAREHLIPLFGICYGLHAIATEFTRNVLGLKDANTTEVSPETSNPVISLLEEQKTVEEIGGTMRLGSQICNINVLSA